MLYRYLLVSSSAQRDPRIGHARSNGKAHRVRVVDAIWVRWHAVVCHLGGRGHWTSHVCIHGHRVLLRLVVRVLVRMRVRMRVLVLMLMLMLMLMLLRRDVIEGPHARECGRRLSVMVLRRRRRLRGERVARVEARGRVGRRAWVAHGLSRRPLGRLRVGHGGRGRQRRVAVVPSFFHAGACVVGRRVVGGPGDGHAVVWTGVGC